MSRPIWTGQISFGLVNVPVALHATERHTDISFHLIDTRDSARVRYERVNEETGEEVPWDKIAKAYEYKEGNYVVLTDEELERVAVAMTKIIEIEQFVDAAAIDPLYFDKPYYLVPEKNGAKGYVLLRAALEESGKIGISRVVIRSRQYLAALMPHGDALVLNLMRFEQEIKQPDEFELPSHDLRHHKVTAKEVALAEQLIDGMTTEWQPTDFHDDYRAALRKIIEGKIKTGHTEEIEGPPEERAEVSTINFMDALKRSLKHKPSPAATTSRRKSRPRKSTAPKSTAPKSQATSRRKSSKKKVG